MKLISIFLTANIVFFIIKVRKIKKMRNISFASIGTLAGNRTQI